MLRRSDVNLDFDFTLDSGNNHIVDDFDDIDDSNSNDSSESGIPIAAVAPFLYNEPRDPFSDSVRFGSSPSNELAVIPSNMRLHRTTSSRRDVRSIYEQWPVQNHRFEEGRLDYEDEMHEPPTFGDIEDAPVRGMNIDGCRVPNWREQMRRFHSSALTGGVAEGRLRAPHRLRGIVKCRKDGAIGSSSSRALVPLRKLGSRPLPRLPPAASQIEAAIYQYECMARMLPHRGWLSSRRSMLRSCASRPPRKDAAAVTHKFTYSYQISASTSVLDTICEEEADGDGECDEAGPSHPQSSREPVDTLIDRLTGAIRHMEPDASDGLQQGVERIAVSGGGGGLVEEEEEEPVHRELRVTLPNGTIMTEEEICAQLAAAGMHEDDPECVQALREFFSGCTVGQ